VSATAVSATAATLPWRLEDIDFSIVQPQRVRGDETLFFLLATSALVETATHHYATNLAEQYADDAELGAWRRHQWAPEELQHGRALRRYVAAVWPQFDWERAWTGFFAEYSAACSKEELEANAALEMTARCVVEAGTSTLYRTLLDYADEPLLREIARRLRDDEVRHYSYFYAAANRSRQTQRRSRWALLRAVARRVLEAFDDDGEIAFRHAWAGRCPARPYAAAEYKRFRRELRARITPHTPVNMSARMLVRPLALPPVLARATTALLTFGLRRLAGVRG
jgi:hypothetical protein